MIFLSIGSLTFGLHVDDGIYPDEELRPFLTEARTPDISVEYRQDGAIGSVEVDLWEENRLTVRYNPSLTEHFATLRGCLIHLPIEQLLLMHDRFILHAALISSSWGGVLFTGNSGVGKSTQAELWHRHRGSTVINGDRAILAKEGCWQAYGSPYAGSSGYYINRREKVAAIVLLEQGSENLLTPVSEGEAFRFLMLQSAAHRQDSQSVERLCGLLEKLIASVPVYRLRCTPDVRAVEALEAQLKKEGQDAGK